MNLRYISWKEFDDALASMPKPICDSFYPIPRGGMVLAVALSHRFGRPIAYLPTKLSILVDDIVDYTFLVLLLRWQLSQTSLRCGNMHVILPGTCSKS